MPKENTSSKYKGIKGYGKTDKTDFIASTPEPNSIGSQTPSLRQKIFMSRIKRKILKHTWVVRSIVLGIIFLGIYLILMNVAALFRRTNFLRYTSMAADFVMSNPAKIKSSVGITNILILGKGGEGHEAPDLTDTIIFFSVNREAKKISMVSLPRDIWVSELRAKLNSMYYWGNKKSDGGGFILAKSTVEEITGQPVHYIAVLDFNGFKKIIDTLGEIEVDVENSFVDKKYPIPGRESDECAGDPEYKCRYETLHFTQGRQVMNGDTALKFVRSRNAEGDEGTDFARAKRQQKVISGVKEKFLSRETLLSPEKLIELKNVVIESTETDLTISELPVLARFIFNARNHVKSSVLPESFLEVPPTLSKYDYLYVFIPKSGDWKEIHKWFECEIEDKNCSN